MELIITCCLALLEMTFVFVGLLLLHGLRKQIGHAAFYIAIGLLLIFTQLVSATGLKVVVGYPGIDFYIAPSVLFLPYLAALLILYVTEGTLAAQRLIIGAIFTLGFYVYISHLTGIQCSWAGYSISQGPSADSLEYLLSQSQRTMTSSILAQTLDLFLIPIFFQRLRNLKCGIFICVLGALILTQLVDTFVFVTACYWGEPQWWLYIKSSYTAKFIATIWLSVIATIYLLKIEHEIPGEGRNALDIVFAFLGSYGRAQDLQRNLQEWEGRYRMVVENASDMILLLNRKGIILDANFAAVRIFEYQTRTQLIGISFLTMITDTAEHPFELENYWKRSSDKTAEETHYIQNAQLHAISSTGEKIELDVVVTTVMVQHVPMLIVFGRDVTEQNRLSKEKETLREELEHAQRLESVGKLAGGVAHDFNNYLYAIQGHLDVLTLMHDVKDKEVVKHLTSINEITEHASKLTQQLLGFARKGKYKVEILDLGELIRETIKLFGPASQKNIDFGLDIENVKMPVRGDAVQLKQVFLNILINARDAIEGKKDEDMTIKVEVRKASRFEDKFKPAGMKKADKPAGLYYCVKIQDNGIGMDKSTVNRIFEPFFTTKPYGKGTGMGLAMVYGTITNHNGWLNVESKKGKGTTFYIFLPHAEEDHEEKTGV